VTELIDATGLNQAHVSRHLQLLQHAAMRGAAHFALPGWRLTCSALRNGTRHCWQKS
jgi:hypothetical protein